MTLQTERKGNKSKRIAGKILLVLFIIFAVLSAIPYALPVTNPASCMLNLPFEESREAVIQGVSIHYREWIPSGEVMGKILMVHGLGGSTFSWEKSVDALTESGYMVIAADLPGFGYSDRSKGIDHSQENRAAILWELADIIDSKPENSRHRNLPWNLTGHSMGGGTVSAMAMENPERTRALILVAGAVFENSPGLSGSLLRFGPAERWARVILFNYAITFARIETFLESAYGRAPEYYEIRGYLSPLEQPGTTGALTDLVKTARNRPIADLKGKDVDIYGIWGSDDSWVPPESGKRLKEIFPEMELFVIENAAHCPMETHPEEFTKILLGLLED